MKPTTKKTIQKVLGVIVATNALVFLTLAYFQAFASTPRAIVFVDFWGRLCVYSLWFTGYILYRRLSKESVLRKVIVFIVFLNIPVFLVMGYMNMLPSDLATLPFVDFWGRITVYSVWFMAYELYLNFIDSKEEPV